MSDKHYLEEELEELIQSDPKIWRFIQEASLDGVWYWDLTEPEHEFMSPEFWRLLGFDPAERQHLAEEWQDLIHPDDLALAKRNLEQHLADPEHPYDQVVRYRRADGETAWVRCRGIAIRDKDGVATRLLGAHNDLTALKAEEGAAKRTNHLLSQIMNTTQSAIIGLDERGGIASINSAGRHFLGGRLEQVPFAWPAEIAFYDRESLTPLQDDDSPITLSLAGEALSGFVCMMTRAASEDRRYVRISSAPVGGGDEGLSSVVIVDDVTEQEKHRQQVERTGRLDALGQLTGGIAHDFNNLLATVQYALQLAEGVRDEQRRTAYLETAKQSIERGSELTRRLLAFAKQQPGLAKSQDVGAFIEQFRRLASPVIESSIELDFAVNERDLLVFCDPAQLENALLNLVLNARDAITRSGIGKRISIRVRSISELGADTTLMREQPGSYVTTGLESERRSDAARTDNTAYRYIEFAVSDDGPGMSDEVKNRAIDPFFTTKNENSGTGLGLSMVYGFVQQANGELRIYSEPEQGTTIRLLLPRGDLSGERESPVQRLLTSEGRGETILIVEDEISLLMMMHDLISSLGYDLSTARNADEALDMIKDGDDFDLLITDIIMPGDMSGFDLARKARELRPDMPVLFTSGYTGYSEAEMSEINAQMLQKPCAPTELANAIALELSKAKTAK